MKTIPILHSLGRSGGTIISKCLGCMDNVLLLSEIHPKGCSAVLEAFKQIPLAFSFSPIMQAHAWHDLLDFRPYEAQILNVTNQQFLQQIIDIEIAARERGKQIIIRDWSYVDFIGTPFCYPSYLDTLSAALSSTFQLKHVSLIRDPMDQWLSMQKLGVCRNVSLEQFLEGYLAFLQAHPSTLLFKYEHFTENPARFLQKLTEVLSIQYDPTWEDKWRNFTKITGDEYAKSSTIKEIFHNPYKAVSIDLKKQFEKSLVYQEILSITNYSTSRQVIQS